jgi:putative spermidine/putrescine transport system ATP-binding protein
MGGHNVLTLPRGAYALRADAVRLGPEGIEAVVTAVEYQGTHVALSARVMGDQDILALIPEAQFFSDPKAPGDAVRLAWDDHHLHPLTH